MSVCVCGFKCVCACVYVCVVCVCLYVCVVCMCVYVYVCLYVCVRVYGLLVLYILVLHTHNCR